jgi:hypothetical protein
VSGRLPAIAISMDLAGIFQLLEIVSGCCFAPSNGFAGFSHIVIEYLDRLSKNADWHQGYLIERIQKAGQELAWWKPYHSRIERAVFGAISQDGMEQAVKRMKTGTCKKAESGRVTAKVRAYGYKHVK